MNTYPVVFVLALIAPLLPLGAFDHQPESPRPASRAEAPAAPAQAGRPVPAAPVAQPAPAPVQAPRAGAPEPAPAARAARKPSLPINVRVDIVVTEQLPASAPIVRRAQLATADGESTSVRNHSVWRPDNGRHDEAPFRIDLQADVLEDAKVRLRIGVDYGLARPGDNNGGQVTIRQTVIVRDGQSVVIAETSDPVTERVVKIEAKANIVK